jgi:WD40 repeat protein
MRTAAIHSLTLSVLLLGLVASARGDPTERGPAPRLVDLYGDPLPKGAVVRLGTIRLRHADRVSAAALSPDGRVIASAVNGQAVNLWDARTGRLLRDIRTHTYYCLALAFSPDGNILAAAGGDAVLLFDVATGRRLCRVKDQEGESYLSPAFSADGKWLAVGTGAHVRPPEDGGPVPSGVLLLEVPSGRKARRLGDQGDLVEGVAFAPDGATLASASRDKTLRLWDPRTGKERRRLGTGERPQTRVAFSRDGKRISSGDWDGHVTVWDSATGAELWWTKAHRGPIGSLSFSPDGSSVLAGREYSDVRLFDAGTGRPRPLPDRLGDNAWHGAFSPDGQALMVWGGDRAIHLWNLATARELDFGTGHKSGVLAVAVAPDGKTVVSAGFDGVRVWEAMSGREIRRLTDGEPCSAVAFSPDGKTLAGGVPRGHVTIWASGSGRPLQRIETEDGFVSGVAFAPDGRSLYTASVTLVQQWEVGTGKRVRRFGEPKPEPDGFSRPPPPLSNLAVRPDGKAVAVYDVDRVRIWDTATGKEMDPPKGEWSVPFAFSPDSRTLACAKGDEDIGFWDLANGKDAGRIRVPGKYGCRSLAFAPNGKAIAVVCGDGSIGVMTFPAGKEVSAWWGQRGFISCIAYSPDGQFIVSGSPDSTVLVWDAGKVGGR